MIIASCIFSFVSVPKPVKDLGMESIGRSYVNLKWKEPDGMWSNFSVTFHKEGETDTTVTAAKDKRQLQITPLVAGTTYHVTVYTLSGPYTSSGVLLEVTTRKLSKDKRASWQKGLLVDTLL